MFQVPAINQKYKTTLCKHWMTTGTCAIGQRCHFAHGKEELRSVTDPIQNLPANQIPAVPGVAPTAAAAAAQPNTAHTKTIKCRYFELGVCRYKDQCYFAHSDAELKPQIVDPSTVNQNILLQQYNQLLQQQQHITPKNVQAQAASKQMETDFKRLQDLWRSHLNTSLQYVTMHQIPIPANIIQDQTIQKQITQQQLLHVIQQLEKLPLSADNIAKLRIACDVLSASNIQSAAALLNKLIFDENYSVEVRDKIEGILTEAQQLVHALVSQYQVQYHKAMAI